jgi:hypothetical protein
VPPNSLRLVLSTVLLGSGLGLLSKAGGAIPVPVIAVAPVLVLAITLRAPVLHRRSAPAEGRPATQPISA